MSSVTKIIPIGFQLYSEAVLRVSAWLYIEYQDLLYSQSIGYIDTLQSRIVFLRSSRVEHTRIFKIVNGKIKELG